MSEAPDRVVATSDTADHDADHDKAVRRLLAPYQRPNRRRALTQLLNTAIPFAALRALMVWSLGTSYLLTLLLAVPTAGLFIRLFILQHDCGHGSFLPSRAANDAIGSALGVITLFPYGYWRRTHAMHHASNGNLDHREFGDIATITVGEYRARSRWGRLRYRLYRHPFVLFGVGPFWQFVIKHRFPFDIPWSWKREWQSVLWTNVGIAAAVAGLVALVGWPTFLAVQLTIIALAGPLGVWLFYVQHQFEDTYWEHADAWDFYRAGAHGSSFYDLPRVLHWWTGNIGYHHIHHLASRIPNYHLREAFEENPQLQRVTRLTLKDSLRCARLRLWDEERRSMIGWRELRDSAAGEETSAAA
jgi:omega-6 fatty acid desaturase (delta-12 desaturase)